MRENARAKGLRYLIEGRLVVNLVDEFEVRAICRGQGALWRVGWREGVWYCTCPAKGRCAHLVALQSVVASR